jgi:hypothetical protein
MVAQCANPTCHREFRELSKGRLFLLPPTDGSSDWRWSTGKLSDYCYWLCPECDATLTLVRRDSEVVVSVRGPGSTYPVYDAPLRTKRPRQIILRSYTQAG